jgi:hypothetical protein
LLKERSFRAGPMVNLCHWRHLDSTVSNRIQLREFQNLQNFVNPWKLGVFDLPSMAIAKETLFDPFLTFWGNPQNPGCPRDDLTQPVPGRRFPGIPSVPDLSLRVSPKMTLFRGFPKGDLREYPKMTLFRVTPKGHLSCLAYVMSI